MEKTYNLYFNNELVYVGFKPEIHKIIANTLEDYDGFECPSINFKIEPRFKQVLGIKKGERHFYDYEKSEEGRFEGYEFSRN